MSDVIRITIEVPVRDGYASETSARVRAAVEAAVELTGAAVINASTLGDAAPVFAEVEG
jgi:hypothetical protein